MNDINQPGGELNDGFDDALTQIAQRAESLLLDIPDDESRVRLCWMYEKTLAALFDEAESVATKFDEKPDDPDLLLQHKEIGKDILMMTYLQVQAWGVDDPVVTATRLVRAYEARFLMGLNPIYVSEHSSDVLSPQHYIDTVLAMRAAEGLAAYTLEPTPPEIEEMRILAESTGGLSSGEISLVLAQVSDELTAFDHRLSRLTKESTGSATSD